MQNIIRVQELHREAERRTLHSLGGGKTFLITWNSTKAQHDKRKVINPVRASKTRSERSFQGTMKTFHKAENLLSLNRKCSARIKNTPGEEVNIAPPREPTRST